MMMLADSCRGDQGSSDVEHEPWAWSGERDEQAERQCGQRGGEQHAGSSCSLAQAPRCERAQQAADTGDRQQQAHGKRADSYDADKEHDGQRLVS
jgi:hypothetical protein